MSKQTIFVFFLFCLMLTIAMPISHAASKNIEQLRKELKILKQAYDEKITTLEERLIELEQSNDEVNEVTEALAIEVSQQGNQQAVNSFNPGIGVILNGKLLSQQPANFEFSIPGFFQAGEIGPGEKGLALGETELNFSANIDDKFYGSITLAFGEGEANVEEAYMQTIALDNGLSIKAGRFFSNIGYLSRRHRHSDDFSDRPLPYEAFLGGGYGDDGIQLNWIAATEIFWESGVELYRGENFPAAGAANRGIGSWTAYSHIGADIDDSQSWQAGISYVDATVENRQTAVAENFTGDSQLSILDFVWKWAPNGNPTINNAKIQAEYLTRSESGLFTAVNGITSRYSGEQQGWYIQGIYQFMPQWRTGVRISNLESDNLPAIFNGSTLDTQGIDPKRTSLMVDWSNSEFSRIRLQYSQDKSSEITADIWTLQYVAAFGAHGAHSF